jgi:hypothetical protein
MADTKVSALTAVATPALTDQFPVNQSTVSKRETLQQVLDGSGLLAASGVAAAADLVHVTQSGVAKAMSIQKVSAAAAMATTDSFAVIQSAAAKEGTLAQLITLLQTKGMPRVKYLTSQHSNSTTTPTKVTDLDLTLEAGHYMFDYYIIERSATITVAPQYNLNFSGTATRARWWFQYADLSSTLLAAIGTAAHNVSTTTLGFGMSQAEDTFATTAAGNMHPFATTNAVQTIATDILVKITGLITVSVSGDLQLWHGSETATATTVEVGSSLSVVRTG